MNNKQITKQAVREVLRDYWFQYRKHPFYSVIALLTPAIGTVFVFFLPPLIIARLVNTLSLTGHIYLSEVAWYIALFGVLWLFGEACWRIGMHFLIKLEAEGLSNLSKSAFHRLTERDYDFYTNNFVGSLTKMAFAYSRGFETFTDTLSFNVATNVLPVIFAIIILWHYSPIIPLMLILCIVIAISIGLPIVKKRSALVAARHEANSKVSGRFSDALTNILAVKSFANESNEQITFDDFVNDSNMKWKLDYKRFRIWLRDKYDIEHAYIFIGLIPKFKELYVFLQDCGFELVFKDVIYSAGKPKGNCDSDLLMKASCDLYEGRLKKAVIVASDGDYAPLIKVLFEKRCLAVILSPSNIEKCSILLKRTGAPIAYIDDQRSKLEFIKKAPDADGTA